MSISAARSRLIEYGVVAPVVHETLTERVDPQPTPPVPAVSAVLLTALAASVDESFQLFVPGCVFGPIDTLLDDDVANMVATAAGPAMA